MKKTFALILVVVTLLGLNAAAVSADGTNISPAKTSGGSYTPMGHGVDH